MVAILGVGPAEIIVLALMVGTALIVWLAFAKRFGKVVNRDLREEVEQLRGQVARMQDEIEQLRDENERLRGSTAPPADTGIKPSDK